MSSPRSASCRSAVHGVLLGGAPKSGGNLGAGTPADPWTLTTPPGLSELRGRFGNYVPPVLEALGLAEVEHNARNNRMRAR